MNLYPALKFEMGLWQYFVVKMSASELAETVKFASEVYDDRTLDQAIQRILKTSRVRTEIVTYLQKQPWRFFSSIVVAALGGEPQFYPVEITDEPQFKLLANDRRLNEAFGVLAFDGTQDYYALDGQHRLAAIRAALDKNDAISTDTPSDFKDDEFSVLVVVPNIDDDDTSFLEKYRRLFSNLNRYAKPMDNATNIIMDEDDAFAIITRRLISDHPFFQWQGRQREHPVVKTSGGKNLRSGDPYFTSLETLYEMNTILLSSRWRENEGWNTGDTTEDLNTFKRFRPDEDVIDGLYDELASYWDALLDEVPDLHNEAERMRSHAALDDGAEAVDEDGLHQDHLLFWPIGQVLFARVLREVLDRRLDEPRGPTRKKVSAAIDGLGKLEWRLSEPPWRNFLIIYEESSDGRSGRWKMRSEERKQCLRIAHRLLLWQLGVDELESDEVGGLYADWSAKLIPYDKAEADKLWERVKAHRVA